MTQSKYLNSIPHSQQKKMSRGLGADDTLFRLLEIGIWILFAICYLVLGIFTHKNSQFDIGIHMTLFVIV